MSEMMCSSLVWSLHRIIIGCVKSVCWRCWLGNRRAVQTSATFPECLLLATGLAWSNCRNYTSWTKAESIDNVRTMCAVYRLWSTYYGHWTCSCYWSSAESSKPYSARHRCVWCMTMLPYLFSVCYYWVQMSNPQTPGTVSDRALTSAHLLGLLCCQSDDVAIRAKRPLRSLDVYWKCFSF